MIYLYYQNIKKIDKFLESIHNGKIKLVLKIGVYLTENRYGEIYDHGCGFAIAEGYLKDMFYQYDIK